MRPVVVLIALALAFLWPPPLSSSPLEIGQVSTCFWHDYIDEAELNAVAGQPYWTGTRGTPTVTWTDPPTRTTPPTPVPCSKGMLPPWFTAHRSRSAPTRPGWG